MLRELSSSAFTLGALESTGIQTLFIPIGIKAGNWHVTVGTVPSQSGPQVKRHLRAGHTDDLWCRKQGMMARSVRWSKRNIVMGRGCSSPKDIKNIKKGLLVSHHLTERFWVHLLPCSLANAKTKGSHLRDGEWQPSLLRLQIMPRGHGLLLKMWHLTVSLRAPL